MTSLRTGRTTIALCGRHTGGTRGPYKISQQLIKNAPFFFLTDKYLPIGPCGPLTVFPMGPWQNTEEQYFLSSQVKCNTGLSYPISLFSFLSLGTRQHTVTWRVILCPERKELILLLTATIVDLQNLPNYNVISATAITFA